MSWNLHRRRFKFFALVLWFAIAGCNSPASIPPPTEVTQDIETVHEAVWENEDALLEKSIESQVELLERTLAQIESSYGKSTVELIQGLTATASLLVTKDRPDLALPFMERALALSRNVYGFYHRETAYALHDVAVVLSDTTPGEYLQRAELLFRGALDVRRQTVGPDHPESAASEAQLAWQLLLCAHAERLPIRVKSLLAEAEQLALHAQAVFAAIDDASYSQKLHRIVVETAFARGDFTEVERRAQALLAISDYEKGPGLYPEATASDLLEKALKMRASPRLEVEVETSMPE